MMIAISSAGENIDARVDPRFGRCRYFIIADPDSLEYKAMENAGTAAGGGAGIAAAQQIAGKKVTAVLTGNCGPNAFEVLQGAGIALFTGVDGTVREAVAGYKAGKLQATTQPTVSAHTGMR